MDNPKFSQKQRLMKQTSEAIAYAKQCEANVKRKEQHYNARYNQWKKQMNDLKLQNKALETQNKVKDQLLREKTKDIVAKTTQIVKLKDEIYALRLLLNTSYSSHSYLNSNPNPKSNSKTPRNPKQMKPAKLTKQSKQKDEILKSTKIHHKDTNMDLPNIPPKESKSPQQHCINFEYDDLTMHPLPFIHRKSSTNTSTLSAAAVKIKLPSPTLTLAVPNDGNLISAVPLQLSPICEWKSRDEHCNASNISDSSHTLNTPKSPLLTPKSRPNSSSISLIKISDDNSNIDDEWEEAMADTADDSENGTMSNMSKRRGDTISVSADDADHPPSPNDSNLMVEPGQVGVVQTASSNTPNTSGNTSCEFGEEDAISYCTDNTMMYQDMIMDEHEECYNIQIDQYEPDGGGHDGLHDGWYQHQKQKMQRKGGKGHFSKQSNGNLSGCDLRIEAPMNIFSINHSFKIVLNDNEEQMNYGTNIASLMTSKKNVSTDK